MYEILIEVLGSFIRAGAIALSAYLVEHHIMTADQGDHLTMEMVKHLTLILPGALAIVWSILKVYWNKKQFLVALSSPEPTTENKVKAIIKSGTATPTIFTPPDTIPGVPLPPPPYPPVPGPEPPAQVTAVTADPSDPGKGEK